MTIKAEILQSEIARLKSLAQEYAEDEAHAMLQANMLANRREVEHPVRHRAGILGHKTHAIRSRDASGTYAALAGVLEGLLPSAKTTVRTFWSETLKRTVSIPQ